MSTDGEQSTLSKTLDQEFFNGITTFLKERRLIAGMRVTYSYSKYYMINTTQPSLPTSAAC